MKASTIIYVGIRNIGERSDPGQIFNGTLKESVLWLAQRLNEVTMADRIAVGIGRDESGARKAFETIRGASSKTLLDSETLGLLDSLFDPGEHGCVAEPTDSASPHDTYKG